MKNFCFLSMAVFLMAACGNASTDNEVKSGDSVDLASPVDGDTTKHPSGVDNSSVISTDTAAINVQNTIKKADSLSKRK